MNRNEYLSILSQRLSMLPADEYNNIMEYYTEYFEDAGAENEENVIAELGDVHALADKILSENGQTYSQPYTQPYTQPYNQSYNQLYNQQQPVYSGYAGQPLENQTQVKGLSTGMKVLVGILMIPVWIVMGALIFSFGVASVSLFASSVAIVVAGCAVLGTSAATGIAFVGAGFIVFAVGMGMMMATAGVSQGLKAICRAIFADKQTVRA